MSEQRKRLTDAEYESRRLMMGIAIQGARDQEALTGGCAADLEALEADHLQAREDRKRLAAALRARLVDCCGEPDTTGRCAWCLRDAALLAEVDPQ